MPVKLHLNFSKCQTLIQISFVGMPIVPGSGLGRALEYWQKTAFVIPTRESLMK